MRRALQVAFFAAALLVIAQGVWHHAHSPERVAVHFNLRGEPDRWASRDLQLGFHLGTIVFLGAVFQTLLLVLRRVPDKMVNLPDKHYWLAPERRAATYDWLAGVLLGLGTAVVLFLGYVFHVVHRANLSGGNLSLSLWPAMGLLVAIVATAITAIYRRFRLPATPTP